MCGTVAGVLFYFGIASALPRSYYDYKSEEDRKKVFTTALLLTVVGALMQILFAYGTRDFLSLKLFSTNEWGGAIFLALCASAVGFITQLFLLLMRFARLSLLVSFVGVTSLVLNLGLTYFLLTKYQMGVFAPIWGLLITNIIMLLFVCIICRKHIGTEIMNHELKIQLTFGFSTVVISAATMVVEWSDRYFINKFLTLQDVGIYSVGYKFASVVTIFLITPFVQIWNPIMMENYKNDDFVAFFTRVLSYYFMIGVVVLTTASLFMNEVLFLIVPKQSYFQGLLISPIIMFGLLLNGLNNFLSAGLFFERKIHKMMYVYCVMAALYVVLNYFLIPRFGYKGAAWSSFFVYGVTPLVIYQLSKKYYEIHFSWKKIIPLMMLSFLVVLVSPQIEILQSIDRIFVKCFFLILVYTIIYSVILTEEERSAGKAKLKSLVRLLK